MTETLHSLTVDSFQPYLGRDFIIEFPGGGSTVAQLAEVMEFPPYPGLNRRPFSILLQTDQLTFYYPQAIYSIKHPAGPSLSLFLVPLGVRGGGMQYEAVFS